MLFTACEKVIDLPLKDAEPRLVIEGVVDDTHTEQWVKISETTPFDSSAGQTFISGAAVRVLSSAGKVVSFEERKPGYYLAQDFKGVSGQTYRLEVNYKGEMYSATSTMPSKVPVDSIGFSESTILDRSFRTINVLFQDPAEEKNFYRFIIRSGYQDQKYSFIFNDKYNNGKKVIYNMNTVDMDLAPSDSLILEAMMIDGSIYDYWKGVEGQNPGASNPANPPSNISNGALGYFSAHTLRVITVEVE